MVAAAPPPRSAKKSDQTRDAIIAATTDLLRQGGLSRARTRNIAKAAGVAEGTIYLHFGDRVNLFKAVFDRALPDFRNAIEGAISTSSTASPDQRLLQVVVHASEFFHRAMPLMAAALADPDLLSAIPQGPSGGKGPERAVEGIAAILRGRNGDTAKRLDSNALAEAIVGAVFLRVTINHLRMENFDITKERRALSRLLKAVLS